MTTAMQILSVERRRLTITLMYGIITAEKEFLRSRIFYFLIASISHRNGLDHTFDHLPIRTMWKQCEREHRKASFSDTKAPKSPRNQEKNYHLTLRDQEVVGSNPVTPTKKRVLLFGNTFFFVLLKEGFERVGSRKFTVYLSLSCLICDQTQLALRLPPRRDSNRRLRSESLILRQQERTGQKPVLFCWRS